MNKETSSFELTGIKEALDVIETLDVKTQGELIKSVIRKGASQEIVSPLRSALPYSSNVKKAIKIENIREDKTAIFVGPSNDVYYLRWIDRGTKSRRTKGGANRGSITGKNVMEPLTDARVNPFIKFFNMEFSNQLLKFVEKKIKKLK